MRIPGPALVLPFLLAGCALPPVVTVASLVADGVSYATTGKGTTDHAISAIADEDCALLRPVEGKPMCDPNGEVLIALKRDDVEHENWSLDPESGDLGGDQVARWGSADTQAAKDDQPASSSLAAATPREPGGREPSPVAAKPVPRGRFIAARPTPKPLVRPIPVSGLRTEPVPVSATFAVIGSFRSQENAKRMLDAQGGNAMIQTIVVAGSVTYRVLVNRPVEKARRNGFSDAWPVRLCSDELAVPSCADFDVSQSGVFLASAAAD